MTDRELELPVGFGEPASVPSVAAIMNAIRDAIGVRVAELPAIAEKALKVIREQGTAPAEQIAS
jgi:CO/xanthine dehydrogenase Mo-binding subunit